MTKQKTKLKTLMLAGAVSLGLTSAAWAQSANVAPPVPSAEPTTGLLGQGYTSVAWKYVDFNSSLPSAGRGLSVAYNQPLRTGLDLNVNYDWTRASALGTHVSEHLLDGGVTAYQTFSWGRPFVDVGAGWVWDRAPGYGDDSFAFRFGTGVEFSVAPRLSVTPFVEFRRAVGYNASELDLGAKAAYRINREWSAIAKAQYDAVRHGPDAAEYSLGVAYHF